MVQECSIRPAQSAEAELLTELAHAAKRHWGYPERWIAQWKDALTLTPAMLAEHPVYVAARGTQILGFYALEQNGSTYTLAHLWVHPKCIGQGIGRALFEHAVRTAAEEGAQALLLDSDPHAEDFYRHMGARRVGEVPADMEGTARILPRMLLPLPRSR